MKIPDSFRPSAKIKAERLLANVEDEFKAKRIINQIAEEEWQLDRLEWRRWMDAMRRKFNARLP